MDWDCPRCGRESDSFRSYANHFNLKQDDNHEGNALVAKVGCDRLREMYSEMSENALADELGVARSAVKPALEYCGIDRRGESEAAAFKYDQMSEEERRELTEASREKIREMYGDGGFLETWIDENPEEHAKVAQRAAPLGTPARETNGMEGVTGEDNPNWRGGKDLYDAVVIALPGPSWWVLRDRHRGDECGMCGASDVELHLHHIVPVLAGGTNEPWNFLTLCQECHTAVEWRTREITEPVLTK